MLPLFWLLRNLRFLFLLLFLVTARILFVHLPKLGQNFLLLLILLHLPFTFRICLPSIYTLNLLHQLVLVLVFFSFFLIELRLSYIGK